MSIVLANTLACEREVTQRFENRNIFEPQGESGFYIENWYPDTNFLEKPIVKTGNYVAVLNSYVPSALNAGEGAAFYLNFRRLNNLAIGTDFIAEKEIYPLFGGSIVKADFREFFLTWYPDPIAITNNGNWAFSQDKQLTTPILVLVARDLDSYNIPIFSEPSFRWGFSSLIPSGANSAQIDIAHGYASKNLSVTVSVLFANNPLQILIQQRALRGQFYVQDFTINPAAFPFDQTFSLPDRNSPATRIAIGGGGAGETAQISLLLKASPL